MIYGGLLAIAVLSVVGLFFVVRDEKPAQSEVGSTHTVSVEPLAAELEPEEDEETQKIAAVGMRLLADPDKLQVGTLREQLGALTNELQYLRQQSREIELRCATLRGVAAQIEQLIEQQTGETKLMMSQPAFAYEEQK